jgi:hypothetical protein
MLRAAATAVWYLPKPPDVVLEQTLLKAVSE